MSYFLKIVVYFSKNQANYEQFLQTLTIWSELC